MEQIAARVPVAVFLPSIADDVDQAYDELRAWLADLRAATESLPARQLPHALDALQARLFAPTEPIAAHETLVLVSTPDPLTETKAAVRACLLWAASGIPFRQPVCLDDGPSLAERPLGRRMLALLDLIDSPLPNLPISANFVRVPVLIGHSEVIWVETEEAQSPEQARGLLEAAPVRVHDPDS